MLSTLWLRIAGVTAIALAMLAAIAKVFYTGKVSGKAEVIAAEAKKTDAFREKSDEIDSAVTDVYASLDRLRKRGSHPD